MKHRLSTFLILAAALLCLVGLSSCPALSDTTQSQVDEVSVIWHEINQDGVITPEEQRRYDNAIILAFGSVMSDLQGIDWTSVLVAVMGGASTAFFGTNFFRNRAQGKGGLVFPQHKGALPAAPKP